MTSRRFGRFLALGVVLALTPILAWAADRTNRKAAKQAEPGEVVEMFSAIEKGQIDVKLIPKDSTECRVMIHNKTDKPLSVKLPEAFAGVPVLAQRNNNNNNAGGGFGGGGNQNQGMMGGMGGGMGGMGMGGGMGGGGMGGGGMGMFNVAPEKVGQMKLQTVCLDHGKDEPRAAIPYAIKPLDDYTQKSGVRELGVLLGKGMIDQRSAQVAAWHLNNGMTFEQLAAKQLRFADGTSRPYFSMQEIRGGMQATAVAQQLAAQNAQATQTASASSQSSPASHP